jgi:putative hydrolase of the HAD superfamily
MVKAVLLDLGNTLVSYYPREEFPGILTEAINGCAWHLHHAGVEYPLENLWDRVKEQDHGSPDNRVYTLEARLATIFQVEDQEAIGRLCSVFMQPIFARGRLHGDAEPTLRRLRARGIKTAIVSNTPWGSPADLWRRELERLGLARLVDEAVFCRDVGWRKPDPRVFTYTLDSRWDVEGPRALGMRAVLVDRAGRNPDALHGLEGLIELL